MLPLLTQAAVAQAQLVAKQGQLSAGVLAVLVVRFAEFDRLYLWQLTLAAPEQALGLHRLVVCFYCFE